MNYIQPPIVVPVPYKKSEDPRCPHCDKTLPGWSEPYTHTSRDYLKILLAMILFFSQLFGAFSGGMDGGFHSYSRESNCDGQFFSKKWHYLIPSYQVTCKTVVWLRDLPPLPNND